MSLRLLNTHQIGVRRLWIMVFSPLMDINVDINVTIAKYFTPCNRVIKFVLSEAKQILEYLCL